MNILLTGSTGFVGSVLAKKLAAQNEIVHVLVRDFSRAAHLTEPNIVKFKGEINDRASIATAIKNCDRVYHCAGYAKLWAWDKSIFYTTNVEGTRNMLEESMRNNIKKFIYTSSTAVWGPNPYKIISEDDPRLISFDSDYDLSKYMAEQEVREYVHKGLDAVIVNPSRIYGPGKLSYSNAFTRLLASALKGKTVFLPKADGVVANYAFINDVVDGHIKAMQNGHTGERYILGGENINYRDLFKIIQDKIGRAKIVKLPATLLNLAGWFEQLRAKISGSQPAFTPGIMKRYFTNMAFSCAKAKEQLDYQVTPFEKALELTIQYIRENNYA